MRNSMQRVTRGLHAALAAMLVCATASAAQSASNDVAAPSAIAPVEDLQELAEIRIRGKSLSDMIEDAEDAFVRRYNKVNKDNDFDVVCDYLRLDHNSLALTRTCVPYFLGYLGMPAIAPSGGAACAFRAPAVLGSYGFEGVGTGFSGYPHSDVSCTTRMYNTSISASQIVLRPANAHADSMRQAYMRQVMKAIYRDQDLLDKAIVLAPLYQEMKAVQDHYQKIKAEDDARKEEERRLRREQRRLHLVPALPNKGPRA